MKCPYFNKNECDPPYVVYNVEAYGGGIFRFRCKFCFKTIKVGLSRIVRVTFIEKTEEESDW